MCRLNPAKLTHSNSIGTRCSGCEIILACEPKALLYTSPALASAAPNSPVIDTHIHLFADDRKRFPYHKDATYQPPAAPLEPYKAFVQQAGIDHTVIIHPEPYQDDHSYLEYCFENEPSPDFFKGVCLFDPIRADTGDRMADLVKRNPAA